MQISETRDRVGAALARLAAVEQLAETKIGTPRQNERLVEEIRKLVAQLDGAFREVRQVRAECAEAEQAAATAAEHAHLLFEQAPGPGIVIETNGLVVDANHAAARLLNLTHRHLVGKPFHLFLSADREGFLTRLRGLRPGDHVEEWRVRLRPRERSVVDVTIAATLDASGRALLMLIPARSVPGTAHRADVLDPRRVTTGRECS
jgi:PAS domain S-box-containing protein